MYMYSLKICRISAGEVSQGICTALETRQAESEAQSINTYGSKHIKKVAVMVQTHIYASLHAAIKSMAANCWHQALSALVRCGARGGQIHEIE